MLHAFTRALPAAQPQSRSERTPSAPLHSHELGSASRPRASLTDPKVRICNKHPDASSTLCMAPLTVHWHSHDTLQPFSFVLTTKGNTGLQGEFIKLCPNFGPPYRGSVIENPLLRRGFLGTFSICGRSLRFVRSIEGRYNVGP